MQITLVVVGIVYARQFVWKVKDIPIGIKGEKVNTSGQLTVQENNR
ncbi:hypothetical protein [Peribacillus asahii]|nr:hypothetical protein [Peribacillus asahii]USK60203.1 hypothetical protein LIT37_02200 [Peribacillus asahii]